MTNSLALQYAVGPCARHSPAAIETPYSLYTSRKRSADMAFSNGAFFLLSFVHRLEEWQHLPLMIMALIILLWDGL